MTKHPDQPPTVQELRSQLTRTLSHAQLATVAVWLGLESVERQSDEIFRLGKDAIMLTEIAQSRSTLHRREGADERNT